MKIDNTQGNSKKINVVAIRGANAVRGIVKIKIAERAILVIFSVLGLAKIEAILIVEEPSDSITCSFFI